MARKIHGSLTKNLPQIELVLARHYQGWKSKEILGELTEKFNEPLGTRRIQELRKSWRFYKTIDNNPLAKQLGWIKH